MGENKSYIRDHKNLHFGGVRVEAARVGSEGRREAELKQFIKLGPI